MRIEYFQLIDRIVDLNLADRKIRSEATVPVESTIFEGHFPGYPLMPGVLLIEAMAQTAGWLVVALAPLRAHGVPGRGQGGQAAHLRPPGQMLSIEAHLTHDGSGYAVVEAKITAEGKQVCDASITFRVLEFPNAEVATQMRDFAAGVGLASRGARRWLRPPAKPGSPASASSPALAKARRRIGRN